MESIRDIKRRIGSITSTRQITQSMRLVSTSKIQRARARMENNREFMQEAVGLAVSLAGGLAGSRHPYVRPKEDAPAAVIVISSDRGLCGGYNISVCKEGHLLLRRLGETKIVTVGAKSREYFYRRRGKSVVKSFIGISENPFFEDAGEISQLVLDWYDKGEVSSVYVVYTSFENVLTHVPKCFKLLPLGGEEQNTTAAKGLTRFEPSDSALLHQAVPFYVSSFIYGALLESAVCEQSARMVSMDTAVKNSDEMIEDLTMLFNQARQSAITEELIDIISGANAVTGGKG